MNADGETRPGGPSEPDALAPLRAADPARDARLDRAALRAAVDARIAAQAQDTGATEDDADADLPQAGRDQVHTPARRFPLRRHWMIAASVAAALALGGYGLGAQRAEQSATSAEGPGADTAATGEARPEGASDHTMAQEPDEPDVAGEDAGAVSSTGVQFDDGGLPQETGAAEAWVLDAASTYDAEALTQIASNLGVAGDLEQDGDELTVTGQERSVRLRADAVSTLVYVDESAQQAQSGAAAPQDPLATASGFLDAVGLEAADMTLTEQPARQDGAVQVLANPQDLDVQVMTWQITVTEAGVSTAQGPLAQPDSLGEYPTISAAQAMQRLSDPAFGAGPLSSPDTAGPSPGIDADETPLPEPDPGSALPWPVQQVEFTGATMQLAAYAGPDGQLLLLPTWALDGGEGGTWQVLAVAEAALDTG